MQNDRMVIVYIRTNNTVLKEFYAAYSKALSKISKSTDLIEKIQSIEEGENFKARIEQQLRNLSSQGAQVKIIPSEAFDRITDSVIKNRLMNHIFYPEDLKQVILKSKGQINEDIVGVIEGISQTTSADDYILVWNTNEENGNEIIQN